jgi:hypothetical protein
VPLPAPRRRRITAATKLVLLVGLLGVTVALITLSLVFLAGSALAT